jgi:hypothetical protein
LPLIDSFDGVDDEFVQTGNGDEHRSIVEADGCSKGNVIDESIAKNSFKLYLLESNSTYYYKYYYSQLIDHTYEMNYSNK